MTAKRALDVLFGGLGLVVSAPLWLVIAAAFGFLGVVAGALGAHAAARWLEAEGLPLWDTAVRYQMFHVAPMLAVAWLAFALVLANGQVSAMLETPATIVPPAVTELPFDANAYGAPLEHGQLWRSGTPDAEDEASAVPFGYSCWY